MAIEAHGGEQVFIKKEETEPFGYELRQVITEETINLDEAIAEELRQIQDYYTKLLENEDWYKSDELTSRIAEIGDFLNHLDEKSPADIQEFRAKIFAWK